MLTITIVREYFINLIPFNPYSEFVLKIYHPNCAKEEYPIKTLKISENSNNLVSTNNFALTPTTSRKFALLVGIADQPWPVTDLASDVYSKTGELYAYLVYKLGYRPEDVYAVLEIKFLGSFGSKDIKSVKKVFDAVTEKFAFIQCFFIAISESIKYKHRITEKELGYPVFELLHRQSSLKTALKNRKIWASGDWEQLLKRLTVKR